MRGIVAILVCAALYGGAAVAQSPNPVMDNYRAYNAAMAVGDLAGAETAAVAALAASQARDGDGGHTAVLALNLATVRLNRGERAEAMEPARHALALAGGSSGVDPTLATFILGRAELSQSNDAGANRVVAALQSDAAQALPTEAYDAAVDLGAWAIAHNKYPIGHVAWSKAVDLSPGTSDEAIDDHARALVGLAAVTFLADPHQPALEGAITGSHINPRPNTSPDTLAFGELTEALRLESARAHAPASGNAFTEPQAIYAQALAWRNVLEVMRSERNLRPIPHAPDDPTKVPNQCTYAITAQPLPQYPPTALSHYGIGVVVLRLIPDANGVITDVRIAATVGDTSFQTAVESVLPQCRVTKSPTPAQCQPSIIDFGSVDFVP